MTDQLKNNGDHKPHARGGGINIRKIREKYVSAVEHYT